MLRTIIRMTADVQTPDGSDTNCYGEPCLKGHGYTLESGWVNWNGSEFNVYENREDVSFLMLDEGVLDGDIEETVSTLIGAFTSDDGLTYYAKDASHDFMTGQDSMRAVHVSVEDVTYRVVHAGRVILSGVPDEAMARRFAETLNNKPVDGTLYVVVPHATLRPRM